MDDLSKAFLSGDVAAWLAARDAFTDAQYTPDVIAELRAKGYTL